MVETVIQKQIGYSWKIEKTVTRKIETGAKYPDTEEIKAQLYGNTDTYGEAVTEIAAAKENLKVLLKD